MKNNPSELAEKIHEGNFATTIIEEKLDEIFPEMVCKIGTDSYDNSLEVYFAPNTPSDFTATQEQADKIFEWGFSRFWLNFTDGTEQTAIGGTGQCAGIYERKAVNHPRWTEEQAKEYL